MQIPSITDVKFPLFPRLSFLVLLSVLSLFQCAPFSYAQGQSAAKQQQSILFIGNSFTFAHGSPVRFFHPESVTDLNGSGIGGVPALFKQFSKEAGLDFAVSLETRPGKSFDYHFQQKGSLIAQAWDNVVMQGYSVLDQNKPGDPGRLAAFAKKLDSLFRVKNPDVRLYLVATWARADQVYEPSGHWYGKSITEMTQDIRKGYDSAAAGITPGSVRVVPVGEAWERACNAGIADPNPYDGIAAGQIDLWCYDHYHASAFGYYLEALMIFGGVTGLDPRSLSDRELAAFELGFSPGQAVALQQIAFEELAAMKDRELPKPFIVHIPKAILDQE